MRFRAETRSEFRCLPEEAPAFFDAQVRAANKGFSPIAAKVPVTHSPSSDHAPPAATTMAPRSLDYDTLVQIFLHLDPGDSCRDANSTLLSTSLVSRLWYDASTTNEPWRRLLDLRFPPHHSFPPSFPRPEAVYRSYRTAYIWRTQHEEIILRVIDLVHRGLQPHSNIETLRKKYGAGLLLLTTRSLASANAAQRSRDWSSRKYWAKEIGDAVLRDEAVKVWQGAVERERAGKGNEEDYETSLWAFEGFFGRDFGGFGVFFESEMNPQLVKGVSARLSSSKPATSFGVAVEVARSVNRFMRKHLRLVPTSCGGLTGLLVGNIITTKFPAEGGAAGKKAQIHVHPLTFATIFCSFVRRLPIVKRSQVYATPVVPPQPLRTGDNAYSALVRIVCHEPYGGEESVVLDLITLPPSDAVVLDDVLRDDARLAEHQGRVSSVEEFLCHLLSALATAGRASLKPPTTRFNIGLAHAFCGLASFPGDLQIHATDLVVVAHQLSLRAPHSLSDFARLAQPLFPRVIDLEKVVEKNLCKYAQVGVGFTSLSEGTQQRRIPTARFAVGQIALLVKPNHPERGQLVVVCGYRPAYAISPDIHTRLTAPVLYHVMGLESIFEATVMQRHLTSPSVARQPISASGIEQIAERAGHVGKVFDGIAKSLEGEWRFVLGKGLERIYGRDGMGWEE